MPENRICPYPGLRPFAEEEAIFFKGRDVHIKQIISQLEEKKFMMLTGASGDGKSSLVYAGVIPEARAGFFKAKFNNWIIVDFRPERSPLQNMTASFASHLELEPDMVKKELSYGFSALVNLYKSTPYYLDYESDEWKKADEDTKKGLKSKAANLFILVDQFEEFFTNPENYSQGKLSKQSQNVVNLLLETAKIALEEDLPIYIICTMRSDYIGQCAAFRGLPEYIGFSQFFVPRLKRKELYQVVEEPATLSGNTISQRLIEILINELSEGFDQLPVLQHALNKLWNIAEKGETEMDLIHLAKVTGIPASYLPEKDRLEFKKWFEGIPAFKRKYFKQLSLNNVLDTHANELYETAQETTSISKEDAKLIIKTTFQCLTKIDDGRAVRNRMTLQEITDILNQPHINTQTAGDILNIFREQGNTFIQPFITDDTASKALSTDTVLDITHESLIRNWEVLKSWADDEYDNWLNFQDFDKQLQRWLNSNKSSGYLLPIGPLTFFENWYKACKPNKYWLARYDEREVPVEEKLKKAEETLKNAGEFLRRSARNLFVSRTIIKYGATRIAATFAIAALIIICTFYYFDFRRKQNDYVINEIIQKGMSMIESKKVKNRTKAHFLINYERLSPGSYQKILNELGNDPLAFDIAFETFLAVQNYGDPEREVINPMANTAMDYLNNSLINRVKSNLTQTGIIEQEDLKRINKFLRICAFINTNDKHSSLDKSIKKNLSVLYGAIKEKLNWKRDSVISIKDFNQSIELLVSLSDNENKTKISEIIKMISPFESEESKKLFDRIYPKEAIWQIGWDDFLLHNGGYQIMSYLYAANGDIAKISQCLDSITTYNNDYKTYENGNFYDIINYLTKYGYFPSKDAESLLKKYQGYSGLTYFKISEKINNKSFSFKIEGYKIYSRKSYGGDRYYYNLISYLLPLDKKNKVWDYFLNIIEKGDESFSNLPRWIIESNQDGRNFKLAMYYKKRGVFANEITSENEESDEYFYRAFNYYEKISDDFLNQDFTIGRKKGPESKKIKRSALFLYPSVIREGDWDPYSINYRQSNPASFFDFVLKNEKYRECFKTKEDFETLERFLYEYYKIYKKRDYFNYDYFHFVKKTISINSHAKQTINKNFYDLVILLKFFKQNDTTGAFSYYKEMDLKKISSAHFQKQEEPKGKVHKALLRSLATHLALVKYGVLENIGIAGGAAYKARVENVRESKKILKSFVDGYERRNTIINIVYALQEKGPVENSFIYLDTLFNEIDKENKFGMKLLRVLGMIGSQPIYDISLKLIKDVHDRNKPRAMMNFIRGVAYNGFYYKSFKYIPDYISSNKELELHNEILHTEVVNRAQKKLKTSSGNFVSKTGWEQYDKKVYGDDYWEDYETGIGGVLIRL